MQTVVYCINKGLMFVGSARVPVQDTDADMRRQRGEQTVLGLGRVGGVRS